MKFIPTPLEGSYVIEVEPFIDKRGAFARTWCRDELARAGLIAELSQCSLSRNTVAGTLRGMHFQISPHQETKLVSCVQGAIFDVIVDIRKESVTYGKWFGIELNADNQKSIYVPEGFAHGFISISDHSDVYYQISNPYVPEAASGFRWNDPDVAIEWPMEPKVISERDATYPCLGEIG